MLPTFTADPRIALVAASDLRDDARRRFESDFGARTYGSIEDLCRDPDVEAVYVATPHQMHAQHVAIAARHGKHVLVEKPMAIALDQCQAMIDVVQKADVTMVIGHSHGFNAPILHTRKLIDSGAYGARSRMIHALNYTDYMVRPRRPEEMDTAQGGGVLFSQGAHQIDIVRLLGGGHVQSVRAMIGNWDRARHDRRRLFRTADIRERRLRLADLSAAMRIRFRTSFRAGSARWACRKTRRAMAPAALPCRRASNADEEAALKAARNYGGKNYAPPSAAASPSDCISISAPSLSSCERADLRPMANGVMIYDDKEARLDPVPVPDVPRAEVIDAILQGESFNGKPPLHDGPWSMATLEVVSRHPAIVRRRRAEIADAITRSAVRT